jgi:hypothetical protein
MEIKPLDCDLETITGWTNDGNYEYEFHYMPRPFTLALQGVRLSATSRIRHRSGSWTSIGTMNVQARAVLGAVYCEAWLNRLRKAFGGRLIASATLPTSRGTIPVAGAGIYRLVEVVDHGTPGVPVGWYHTLRNNREALWDSYPVYVFGPGGDYWEPYRRIGTFPAMPEPARTIRTGMRPTYTSDHGDPAPVASPDESTDAISEYTSSSGSDESTDAISEYTSSSGSDDAMTDQEDPISDLDEPDEWDPDELH